MATAGLSFANPLLEKVNVGERPNPYAPYSPTSSIGLGGLAPSAADIAIAGDALVRQSQFTLPEMQRPPAIAFSPSKRELFVNGLTFAADDAATALQSESYLRGPGTQLPTGGDWVPLDEQAYSQYLQSIKKPSLPFEEGPFSVGRLAKKSFGRGVDVMQTLAGRALQLAGAEETGGRIVAQQEEDLRKTSPYERQFTDIESGRGAVEWFVANLFQQGPNLLESIALGLAGAAAGTTFAGPVGTAVGGLAGAFGRKAFKDKVLDAAQKVASGQAKPGSAEYALLRNTAAVAGATATNYAGNMAMGAGTIYGELREQGVGPEDFGARLLALAGSIPYAALDTLGEFFIASRLLGGTGRAALPATATMGQRGRELLRRGATGFAIGAPLEGTTEVLQEGLAMGLSGQDLTSNEAINRFVNSFAAGAAIGGPIGGLANLKSRNPDGTPSAAAKSEISLLTPSTEIVPVEGTEFTEFPRGGYTPAPPGTAVQPYYSFPVRLRP
jgi:hypothetical protein